MEIWNIDHLALFLLLFVPGFISTKVYDLLIPGERRDFTKSLFEVFAYSCLNFAALSWLIILIHSGDFYINHRVWYFLLLVFTLFLAPLVWPFGYLALSSWGPVEKHIVHPIRKPWDYVFGKRESLWVIVHLKDGRRIGGRYDTSSFTSSYPAEEQIHLEEVWKLDEQGKFVEPIPRSKGILILGNEILAVELFH